MDSASSEGRKAHGRKGTAQAMDIGGMVPMIADFNLWELVGGICAVLLFAFSLNIIAHMMEGKK